MAANTASASRAAAYPAQYPAHGPATADYWLDGDAGTARA